MPKITDRERQEKAKKALEKKALYGPDIELDRFRERAPEHDPDQDLASLSPEDVKRLERAGLTPRSRNRAGSFLQKDHSVVQCQIGQEGIEVLSIRDAVEQYDWIKEYFWKAVAVDADKYTAHAELGLDNGYFIRALPGVCSDSPVQSCLYISRSQITQTVHNLIIAEEGSELHIITGCTTSEQVDSAFHVGISEFYVKKGAKISFTMIHNWGEKVIVRPRSATVVEEGGVFISNYVSLGKVGSLQMYPTTRLVGPGAVARYSSIIVCPTGSAQDIGSKVVLSAPETRAEIVARTISTGGKVIARGKMVGEVPGVKGHLECQGLILSPEGSIEAIPELEGKVEGVELSHEAAVGKVAKEEVEYLMARGLSREDAEATIVRGFLNVKIEGLPPALEAEIEKAKAESQLLGM